MRLRKLMNPPSGGGKNRFRSQESGVRRTNTSFDRNRTGNTECRIRSKAYLPQSPKSYA